MLACRAEGMGSNPIGRSKGILCQVYNYIATSEQMWYTCLMSKPIPETERNHSPGKPINLIGRTFGRLLVKNREGRDTTGGITWMCVCSCRNYKAIAGRSLRSGETRSCGCLQKELIGNRARKHGLSKNPRYMLWISAKLRASKANLPFDLSWENIPEIPTICPVLGTLLGGQKKRGFCPNSPSLDRINPKLGYVKGNIRVISHRANQLKSDGTPEELMLVAKDAVSLKEIGSQ